MRKDEASEEKERGPGPCPTHSRGRSRRERRLSRRGGLLRCTRRHTSRRRASTQLVPPRSDDPQGPGFATRHWLISSLHSISLILNRDLDFSQLDLLLFLRTSNQYSFCLELRSSHRTSRHIHTRARSPLSCFSAICLVSVCVCVARSTDLSVVAGFSLGAALESTS